jgi:hypothetical protein
MNKKNMCLISVILLLGIVGNALAVDTDWTNGGGDRQWDNASNWSAGIPTAADKAAIRNSGPGPIIDSGTSAVALQCVLSDWSSSGDTLDITGGSFTTGAWFIIGYQAANNGTFNVSGGTTSVSTDFFVGFMGIGNVNMTGGSITVTDTFGIAQSGGSGNVQLDGGTISSGAFSMNSSASMDMTGTGTLIVNGDVTSTINGYIASGWLTAYGGAGSLGVDYNVTNPGKTTVVAFAAEKASYPSPANGATGVSINADLSWTAGIYAVSHDVYFGTDPTPDETEFQGNQAETTYDPCTMDLDTTYYWQIDEVDPCDPCSPWIGDVWSFTTQTSTATLKKGPYLIYPGTNTQMQVLWQLDFSETCSIEWGLDTSYSSGNEGVSEYGTDHQYKHTITGLTPGTKYYYKVTVGTGFAIGSFTAAPANSATDVKFLMFGDTRTYPANMAQVTAAMNSVIASDPAYQTICFLSGDWVQEGQQEGDWTYEYFNRDYAESLDFQANMAVNGCRGNHEQTAVLYEKYLPYPYVNSCYWSFDYGPVHVAVVDQYISYSTGSAQNNWLINDLANSIKPFKIVMYHGPAWGAGTHSNNTTAQTDIHPLCVQYGVQMCISGHNHNYVRADVEGVYHITTGGGGASLYDVDPGMPYVVTATKTLNFQTVEISGNTMYVTSYKPDMTVIDSFQASGGDTTCGDETCEGAENQCNCPDDCGTPPSTETSCTDFFDNDCDNYMDCDDSDCVDDPACQCGNGECEEGEDCYSCPEDCISKLNGKPSSQYCCGDGQCTGAENPTNCAIDCGGGAVCDDGTCDPGEDQCNCPEDCGTPPSTETNCTDDIDEDCDGGADCDDPTGDCDLDPACDCGAKGDPCTTGADCCSGNCNMGPGKCR